MLHGFGLYPVSLQIDIDSYEGDWRHVGRFRNRRGWLAVAEAEIWTGNDLCATLPVIVGCDENEEEIPAFIAANLLACATSYPEPCYEFAPPILDDLLEVEKAEVRKRWLRENVAAIAAIHDQAEQALLDVETKVAIQTRKSDKAIARLRRQRRFLAHDDPRREVLAEAIAEEEEWQDRMMDWLVTRRDELRSHYDALERKASKGQRPRLTVELLYLINWRHQSTPTTETRDVWEQVLRATRQTEMRSTYPLHLDDEQIAALKEFARDPGWVERKGKIISSPAPSPPPQRKGPPRRIEIDWNALGATTGKPAEQVSEKTIQGMPETSAQTFINSPSTPSPSPEPSRSAPNAKPKTRLERTEARRDEVVARLEAIRKQRYGFPPGSKRFLDAQRKERRLTNFVAALDAEIASLRSRMRPPEPVARLPLDPEPPPPAPTPSTPAPSQQTLESAQDSNLFHERTMLLKRLKALEIEGRKFRPGSPKTQRNQMEKAEVNRRIAALDRRIEALLRPPPVASPAEKPAPTNNNKTKQDLLNEMLRRAATPTSGTAPHGRGTVR